LIWQIFKKDWRLLWPLVSLVAAIQVALEWAIFSGGLFGEDPAATALLKPLTLAWYIGIAALVAATVQQDPIPGVDQDWLIRPIKRGSLLLAKLVFLAVVISVPMFLVNLFDALATGFALFPSIAAALWKEVFVFACFIVPLMALAALARNAAELVVIGAGLMMAFAASVTLSAFFLGSSWCPTCESGVSWLQHVLQHVGILVGGATILGLQYFRRRTTAARALALVGAVALVFAQLPWSVAFAIQQRLTESNARADINVSVVDAAHAADSNNTTRGSGASNGRLGQTVESWRRRLRASAGPVTIDVPVRTDGVAGDELLLADRVEVALLNKDGHPLYHGDNAGAQSLMLSPRPGSGDSGPVINQSFQVPAKGYRKAASAADSLSLRFSLSLMKKVAEYKLAVSEGSLRAPSVGRCATLADRNYVYLRCKTIEQTPFCYSAALVAADGTERPFVLRCVPDYRRHLPAFMEIMGFYGIDLALRDKNGSSPEQQYDLANSYIKFTLYGESTHLGQSFRTSTTAALIDFPAAKSPAQVQ
jgi:hypothetical protein